MSVSSSSSGTRPTCAIQTWACSARPPGSAERDRARAMPSASRSSVSGRPCGSSDGVVLLLPAVGATATAEVAGAVEQPDADDRHAEVGRRLEVVAGEDAEAAGVLRQHLGDAELRREVGDRSRGASVPSDWYQRGVGEVLAAGRRARPAGARRKPAVGGQLRRAARPATSPSSRDRVAAAPAPRARGRGLEQVAASSGCHDQRRFMTSSPRAGAAARADAARTVNRRRALTRSRHLASPVAPEVRGTSPGHARRSRADVVRRTRTVRRRGAPLRRICDSVASSERPR